MVVCSGWLEGVVVEWLWFDAELFGQLEQVQLQLRSVHQVMCASERIVVRTYLSVAWTRDRMTS